jgi:3-hydroxymyristoyl/3-hydroxydecanoyl-(acyl carrier protein) dehydratase
MRFLFVDRILHSVRGERICGIKHVTADDYYLSSTAEGRLHLTSSLIGETLGQLAAWNVMEALDFSQRPVAGVASSAMVFRPAYVGETLLLESYIDALDEKAVQYHSIARVNDEIVFKIDGALGPLLPIQGFIDEGKVRQQYAEIYRPAEWPGLSLAKSTAMVVGAPGEVARARQTNSLFAFDSILSLEPGIRLTAVKNISRSAPYFPDHFPNKPVLPMTVLLECKLNLAQTFIQLAQLPQAYRIAEMRRIKMSDFVYPGDVVVCHLQVKRQEVDELVLSFRTEVEGKRVCVMELLLLPKEL